MRLRKRAELKAFLIGVFRCWSALWDFKLTRRLLAAQPLRYYVLLIILIWREEGSP